MPEVAPPPEGNTRALTHGASSLITIGPRATELRDDLCKLVPAYTDADALAVASLALLLARIERANAHLDEVGLTQGKSHKPTPILSALSTWENSARRLMNDLGLTPTSRAKLGLDLTKTQSLASEMETARAAGERARQRMADRDVPRKDGGDD